MISRTAWYARIAQRQIPFFLFNPQSEWNIVIRCTFFITPIIDYSKTKYEVRNYFSLMILLEPTRSNFVVDNSTPHDWIPTIYKNLNCWCQTKCHTSPPSILKPGWNTYLNSSICKEYWIQFNANPTPSKLKTRSVQQLLGVVDRACSQS